MKRHRQIMVVDDDQRMLYLLQRILQEEGYDVTLAADGVSAMALLEDVKPDLVLLDIRMPGPDGYQVLETLRRHSNVPIIMVTAMHEVASVQRALTLGADDYVRKPFQPLELVARVRAKMRHI
ncbi:response regulator transcription factor [Chloroflexota bacterium]